MNIGDKVTWTGPRGSTRRGTVIDILRDGPYREVADGPWKWGYRASIRTDKGGWTKQPIKKLTKEDK